MRPSPPSALKAWRLDGGLFLLSAAILTLEVLQTKIFAFSLDPLTIYLAIGVCLLGLGASATVLASMRPIELSRVPALSAAFAVAGAATVPLANAAFAYLAHWLSAGGVRAGALLVVLALPYFCFGMTVALILVTCSSTIGRAYAFNLGGSGLGCLAIFPLLDWVGAEYTLIAVSAMALTAALLLRVPVRAGARAATAATAVWLVAATLAAKPLFPFPLDPEGQIALVLASAAELPQHVPGATVEVTNRFSRWDRTGRVDVYEIESNHPRMAGRVGGPLAMLLFQQDASAGSILFGVGDDLARGSELFDRTVYGAGYALGGVRDVLVIGLGGGPDVLTALYHRAERVVGVEINRTTIDLVRKDFRDFVGDPYSAPGVELHRMDGRTFLRTSDEHFDLIQMSGVDTKTVLATGSLSLSENYLYTREAMADLLGHLRPDGMAVITRFTLPSVHRVVSLGVDGLRGLGATEPERHIVVLVQGTWYATLIKRSPFTAGELQRLHAWVAGNSEAPDIVIPGYEILGFSLGRPMGVTYSPRPLPVAGTPYFEAMLEGTRDEFVKAEKFDLSPPTDDRPYFFMLIRPEEITEAPIFHKLVWFALRLIVVSSIFILVPAVVLRRRGLRAPRAGRTLAYFSCLGAGFMLVEVGLIHRFVLFLGHQSYAVSVVLFGILLGGGIGSLLSSRIDPRSRTPLAVVLMALVGLILAYAAGLGVVFDATAGSGFPARLALALALLVPLGMLLGVPFPTGLRALGGEAAPLVAWAIGINGFASVAGSTLGIPFALFAGLRALMLLGAALYVLAVLVAPVAQDESP